MKNRISFLVVLLVVALVVAVEFFDVSLRSSSEEITAQTTTQTQEGEMLSRTQEGEILSSATKHVRRVYVNITWRITSEEFESRLDEFGFADGLPEDLVQVLLDDGFWEEEVFDGVLFGILGERAVLLTAVPLTETQFPPTAIANLFMQIVALPDSAIEDDWKQEILFEGTLEEFFASGIYVINTDVGIMVVLRPEDRLLAEVEDPPYQETDMSTFTSFQEVVYPRIVGNTTVLSRGYVTSVQNAGIVYIDGTFSLGDLGTPVFVIEPDGSLGWLGVVFDISGNNAAVLTPVGIQASLGGE